MSVTSTGKKTSRAKADTLRRWFFVCPSNPPRFSNSPVWSVRNAVPSPNRFESTDADPRRAVRQQSLFQDQHALRVVRERGAAQLEGPRESHARAVGRCEPV